MGEEMTVYDVKPVVNGEELSETTMEFQAKPDEQVDINIYVDGVLAKPNYLLSSKVYTALKWVAVLAIPAASAAVQTIGAIWNLEMAEPVALTIAAIGTFLGALIGISAAKNYLG